MKKAKTSFSILILLLITGFNLSAQVINENSQAGKHLYRPHLESKSNPDTLISAGNENADSLRLKHIQDSIYASELFIRDSILKRQRRIDSLQFLCNNLPKLLEAGLWAQAQQLIAFNNKIKIIGDSVLSNYSYGFLPLSFNQPFTPWIENIPLSSNAVKVGYDSKSGRITALKAPKINWNFTHSANKDCIVLSGQSIVTTKNGKNYYKQLFDSVFYNSGGSMVKIKRYADFYQANASYQKGSFLFTHLYEVKQFGYAANLTLNYYEVVNFCDRWISTDASKVCTIVKYNIEKQGNSFHIIRMNSPSNEYSDGKFVYEFDNAHNLQSVAFNNLKNTEHWKTTIELNEKGNVYRYIYEVNGKTNNTLLFNYYLDDPKAKYKVETISCTFEDDGISYYQKNLTTGKSRVRDHFTAEWGPWQ